MLHLELGKLGHLVAADTLPDTKVEYWHRKNNPTHGFCVSLRQTQSTIPKGRGCISTHISLNTIHSTLLKWVRKSLSGKACTSCLEKWLQSFTFLMIFKSMVQLPDFLKKGFWQVHLLSYQKCGSWKVSPLYRDSEGKWGFCTHPHQ